MLAATSLNRLVLPPKILPAPANFTSSKINPTQPLRMSTDAASSAGTSVADDATRQDPTVQYVILRKDLWTDLKWPLGSVVAQACHASSAAMWESKEDQSTTTYCAPENIDHMHKVVLEVKNEVQLRSLSDKLKEAGIQHKLWIEQPENYATCLATKPYQKSQVAPHLKKFQLCKSPIG